MNEAAFWAKVDKGDDQSCWEWTGYLNNGYGQFGRNSFAHRISYELLIGPIPEGLEIDHLCRNPACVNPAHLEAVTHGENLRRSDFGKFQARKTLCPQGHEYSPENTYVWAAAPGGPRRFCKTCRRTRWQRRRTA